MKEFRPDVLPDSRTGLPLIVLALLVHIGSVWAHVFFTSGVSLLLLTVGVSLFFWGRQFTRRIAFALGFLVFMFPLPIGVIDAFSFPLKLKVASMAGEILHSAGLSFFREGVVFHLARTTLTIDDPCSGIRSLFSLMAVGAWVAYSFKISTWKKVVLFLSTFPIAIFVNVLRVCALILAAQWWGAHWAFPEHWFHTASGIGGFVMDEKVKAAIFRQVEKEPFALKFGLRLVELNDGYSKVEMNFTPDLQNIFGMAHGGALFALIDEAFETASNSHGTMAVALNMNLTFHAAAKMGERLTAQTTGLHAGRRTATYFIEVTDPKSTRIVTCQALAYRKDEPLEFAPV